MSWPFIYLCQNVTLIVRELNDINKFDLTLQILKILKNATTLDWFSLDLTADLVTPDHLALN
jgi:hypothetical protein